MNSDDSCEIFDNKPVPPGRRPYSHRSEDPAKFEIYAEDPINRPNLSPWWKQLTKLQQLPMGVWYVVGEFKGGRKVADGKRQVAKKIANKMGANIEFRTVGGKIYARVQGEK